VAYREVVAVDPLTESLEEGTEPYPEVRRTFHEGLMRFVRNEEAVLARAPRASPNKDLRTKA
jgi:hypothetical protein